MAKDGAFTWTYSRGKAKQSVKGVFGVDQVKTAPDPISQRAKQAVSSELESLLMSCLAKLPAARPSTADELSAALDRLPTAGSWTDKDARQRWRRYIPNLASVSTTKPPESEALAVTVIAEQLS
ncbi:MAG: hypothetical protein ACKV2Q_25495 [Planctomycetaceae bacterium]